MSSCRASWSAPGSCWPASWPGRSPRVAGAEGMTGLDHFSTAREMAAAVRERTISARELLELHLARIEEVNPQVNALVSLDPDRARAQAAEADERLARGAEVGPLHGLPYAVKDTHEVAGWRTTYGSPLHGRPRARPRQAGRGAGAGRRCGDRGQDQHPRARVGLAHLQPRLRHHGQPLRPVAAPPAAPAAAPRSRWPPAWWRSPTAATWAARCATPRRSTTSWGCAPAWAGCRSGRTPTPGRPCR